MIYWKSDWGYNLLGKYKYKLLLDVNENEVVKIPDYINGKVNNDDIFFHHGNNGIEKIECNHRLTVYVLDEEKEIEDKEVMGKETTASKYNNSDYHEELLNSWYDKVYEKAKECELKSEEYELGYKEYFKYKSYSDGLYMAIAMLHNEERKNMEEM